MSIGIEDAHLVLGSIVLLYELPTDSAFATSEVSDVSLDLVAVSFPYACEFLQ